MNSIFANKKASSRFADALTFLPAAQSKRFADKVRALFDKKITSLEGEYNEFQITESDIKNILQAMR